MDTFTLDDGHSQKADSTTNTHGSYALVQGEAVEDSNPDKPDYVPFFDKASKRWKLDGETNM